MGSSRSRPSPWWPARLELLAIAGRRVLSRDLTGLGPGQQVLNPGDSGHFRAGIHLVRTAQEGCESTGKAAIVPQFSDGKPCGDACK